MAILNTICKYIFWMICAHALISIVLGVYYLWYLHFTPQTDRPSQSEIKNKKMVADLIECCPNRIKRIAVYSVIAIVYAAYIFINFDYLMINNRK